MNSGMYNEFRVSSFKNHPHLEFYYLFYIASNRITYLHPGNVEMLQITKCNKELLITKDITIFPKLGQKYIALFQVHHPDENNFSDDAAAKRFILFIQSFPLC